jgi:hypothetical protein
MKYLITKILKPLATAITVSAITFANSNTAQAIPPSTIKAGLPITLGTTNYVGYSFVDPTAVFGVGVSYNLYFGGMLSLGLTGGMAFNPSFPNPAYIGGGASINYVISGGSATISEGDFLTIKSYPEFTSYVGLGFAAKQFDFSSQVAAATAGGEAVIAGASDIDVGTFYGLMLNAGADYRLGGSIVIGGEFHYIFALGATPTDPMANIIEIILGAGYML